MTCHDFKGGCRCCPLISGRDCAGHFVGQIISGFFDNSIGTVISFFAGGRGVSIRRVSRLVRVLGRGGGRWNVVSFSCDR